MSRADLILALIKAGFRGDQAQLRKTVEAMAAEERAKNHTILSDRLMAQIQETNGARSNGFSTSTSPRITGGPLFHEITPKRNLEDLILPKEAEGIIRELVQENLRADLLRAKNLEPRHRILFAGPPGNGKTSLTEALASALGRPLLVVRYEAVVGSYLGETAQRLSQVFEYARSRECVLFFDEFDAVGKERGDTHETGEIKRVVSSLLLQIDALPSYVMAVTASNHPELLDRAVWRRFQIRLELPPPTPTQIARWFEEFEKRFDVKFEYSGKYLGDKLKGTSFSEIEQFALDVLRKHVLAEQGAKMKPLVSEALKQWKAKFTLKSELSKEGK